MIRQAAILSIIVILSGCAAVVPSVSSGSSESSFLEPGDIPRRVTIEAKYDHAGTVSDGMWNYDPVGEILAVELRSLGFIVVEDNPDGIFVGKVQYSDFSPVHLELTLINKKTGRVQWSAAIVRKHDMYASVVSASESNARKAIELLGRDLSKVGFRR